MRSVTSVFNTVPHGDSDTPQKRWYDYLPLCGAIIMLLAPHPSWLYVLVDFHLRTVHQPFVFTIHVLVSYTLTFMIFSSLVVCVARDPGPVYRPISQLEGAEEEETGLTEALMPDRDLEFPGKWCRKCWAPKPERAHHCSSCGRCVLKMDHHCPWLGSKCIGHRTYPAFVHFICSVACFALYVAVVATHALVYAFQNPLTVHEFTPVHEICLAFMGGVISLVMGSFSGYHLYLTSTNQTTLENTTPFMILRHLPPLPQTGHSLSDPPLEAELSYDQRRLVIDAHSHILLYDNGFRKNWAQVFGWNRKYGWLYRLWYGGVLDG